MSRGSVSSRGSRGSQMVVNIVDDGTTEFAVISGYFHEFANKDDNETDSLMSFRGLCRFLTCCKLFSSNLDHRLAVEVFETTTEYSSEEVFLSLEGFRAVLESLAGHLFLGSNVTVSSPTNSLIRRQRTTSELIKQAEALQELLRIAQLHHGVLDGTEIGELLDSFYDEEVIGAAYEYVGAFRALFNHYATAMGGAANNPTTNEDAAARITCQSAYRLCRATGFVPNCIVSGEFADVALGLLPDHGKHNTSAQRRYFEEEYMIPRGDHQQWMAPSVGVLPGEPRYNFPEFLELLVAAALCALPRLHRAPPEARAQRIHQIFGNLLGLPTGEDAALDFDAQEYLVEMAQNKNKCESQDLRTWHRDLPGLPSANKQAIAADDSDLDLPSIIAKLDVELPALPPSREEPHLPGPPDEQKASLRQQPKTKDELVEEAKKARLAAAMPKHSKRAVKPFRHGKLSQSKSYLRSAPLDQVTFYAKRPTSALVAGEEERRQESRIAQLELFQTRLDQKRQQASSLNTPANGWVLRMVLIDEPLRAPPCPESEEVSTLIETAIASRRLRRCDAAAALLIRARALWATLKADRDVPPPWVDVQPHVSTPSPWDDKQAFNNTRTQNFPSKSATPIPGANWTLDQTIYPSELNREGSDVRSNASDNVLPVHHRTSDRTQLRQLNQDAQSGNDSKNGRYDPKVDFALATSKDNADLAFLPAEAGLFFFCELASLHTALHEDGLAAQLLWSARHESNRLPTNHPDTAVVWCGLGRVAFHSGEFDVAARAMARAREIRERTIGGDTVETATSYNNLACCLAEIGRPREALVLLELAGEILRVLAGEDHPRTQTALRNLEKARTAKQHLHCEVPYLFSLPVRNHVPHTKKTHKKKKHSRSRSKSEKRRSITPGRQAISPPRGNRSRGKFGGRRASSVARGSVVTN